MNGVYACTGTDEFVAGLDRKGLYHARNRGYFHELTELPALQRRSTDGGLGEAAHAQSAQQWEAFVRYFVGRICAMEGVAFCESAFVERFAGDWRAGQMLASLVEAMRDTNDLGPDAEPIR